MFSLLHGVGLCPNFPFKILYYQQVWAMPKYILHIVTPMDLITAYCEGVKPAKALFHLFLLAHKNLRGKKCLYVVLLATICIYLK
jgi:hypothetical protein